MNARMCEQTFGRTNMHADRQTDGLKHTNACIDERRLVRSNIWMHEHACGQTNRQTDRRTDRLTYTYALTHACMHIHER